MPTEFRRITLSVEMRVGGIEPAEFKRINLVFCRTEEQKRKTNDWRKQNSEE